jgi:hypothetical protein
MSDAQLTLLLAAIATLGGSLVGALRWAVNRVTKASDDGTAALIANAARNAENTASNASLGVKIDSLVRRIDDIGDFVEESSGVHDATEFRKRYARERTKTPRQIPSVPRPTPTGYYPPRRPKTDTDTDT